MPAPLSCRKAFTSAAAIVAADNEVWLVPLEAWNTNARLVVTIIQKTTKNLIAIVFVSSESQTT